MTKRNFYFVRHGETLFNLQGRIQGSSDSPLTKRGIEQGKIAGQYFKDQGIRFDSAYSSTQERASDTLELITDLDYTRVKGLKEWDFGTYEAYPSYLVPRDQFFTYFPQFGGENLDDVIKRVNQSVQDIVTKDNGQSILVVTHSITLKVFYEIWKDYNQIEEYQGDFPNCVVLNYEYEDGKFSLVDVTSHDFSQLQDMPNF
ncbi:2,3-bisphosphoglycerate-dependent phosphoglycerate mutase [Alloiococcus otitis]|uniref:Alpha-ribazole phosphatase n=1 Tax=Alloiococcus otitis ATCC 51267 TaxID=883081 RepID=K9EXD7_9LACT|nr:histidine phosphatase family protein [Alloiococcus otitis]EKU93860.1 hypothetical protein HMPREF9698_00655 [Alloiococcus otitis ATCC 51267]SUU81866.1 2,3-bisphosphoglycerate-dependent phosphoglycerate mutase [Alloiococcus otitis]